jgi:hypothetical protein
MTANDGSSIGDIPDYLLGKGYLRHTAALGPAWREVPPQLVPELRIYHAHRFDYSTPVEETFEAFADLVRSGKVLYVGISQ